MLTANYLNMKEYCIIMTTFSDHKEKNNVIESLLGEKLAACIQEINIGSHYSWKNEICNDSEILLLIKTRWDKYERIVEVLTKLHSYEVPEIVAVNIEGGYEPYLNWIREMTK